MKQFSIVLEDKPGELARICDMLKAVNIRQITTEKIDGGSTKVKLLTADDNSVRSILKGKFDFSEEELLFIRMLDRPGELGKLAHAFSDKEINILDIYNVERGVFAVKVSNTEKETAIEIVKALHRA